MKAINKIFPFFFLLLIISCTDGPGDDLGVDTNSLAFYVSLHTESDEEILIACAASEPESSQEQGVSVYFYPETESGDFRYYETSFLDVDPNDYSNYTYKERVSYPVFNGYLRRYLNPIGEHERWVILTYTTTGKIHICDPIRLKQNQKPSIYENEKVEIDLAVPVEPRFSWENDTDPENIIYFQVVSDSLGNLISGTYTYEKQWSFYDLSNVVLNIADTDPPPVLLPEKNYHFTLMGVSEDNWVNLIAEKDFITR